MRTAFFAFLLVPLLWGCSTPKQSKGLATNFDVKELGDGVYACISTFGGKAIGNAGIVDNGESTIIFDTFLSPDAADEMIRVVKHLGLSPIRYVVNSHGHNDHVRGNQSFPPDVKIISTRRTKDLIERDEPLSIAAEEVYGKARFAHFDSLYSAYRGDTTARQYVGIKMMRAYFDELSKSHEKIHTRVPDTLVAGEASLDGARRRVRLIEMGKGHTESDLILYLPEEEILFAGDLVFHNFHPYLADGDPAGLKSILHNMEMMKVKVVVPGHGDVTGKEAIAAMTEYVESIESIAAQLKREGSGKEAIDNIQIPEKYKEWWLDEFFRQNVAFVYNRLTR